MMTMDATRQRPSRGRALPPFAVVTDRATRVAQRAEELARAGREDEAAVAELLELARGRRRTLADATQLLRINGEHLEIRRRNRAVRLLTAATTGQPIKPEPADVSARLDLLEGLASLPPRLAFETLAVREPRLLALHDKLHRLARPRPRRLRLHPLAPPFRGHPPRPGRAARSRPPRLRSAVFGGHRLCHRQRLSRRLRGRPLSPSRAQISSISTMPRGAVLATLEFMTRRQGAGATWGYLMRKSRAVRVAGFVGALGASAALVGFAASGTGAYFTDSHIGHDQCLDRLGQGQHHPG